MKNIWFCLSLFLVGIIAIGLLGTNNAFAASGISTAVANDPDDADTGYSVGDTITITFPAAVNASFASGTMTNTEFRANFTIVTTDIDTADILTGVWNAVPDAITFTINTIAGVDPPVVNTDTVAYDVGGNIGYGINSTHFLGTPVTLTGDFGLFVAVKANGGDGCDGDCDEPTLGVNNKGKRLVDNGFTYNGYPIDVERYFTPYPLITVDVGKQNKAVFKIYDNLGLDNIRHFDLAFGLVTGQILGTSNVIISWDKSFAGTETISIVDPHNVLDNVRVITSEGSCRDSSTTNDCLIVTVYHTFRESLDFDMVGTNVWDYKRNAWQNFYNHGIHIEGESLNPPEEYVGIHKGKITHLFETGKNTAVDENGNTWTFDNTWKMDYILKGKIVDGVTQHGIDRNNAWFNHYKQGQELLAQEAMNQLCPSCSDEEFAEISDVFAYEFPERISKLSDPEIQNKMLQQSKVAENTLQQIFDSLYGNNQY